MKCFRAFSVFTLAIYEGHDLFPALPQLLLLHRTVRITPFQFIVNICLSEANPSHARATWIKGSATNTEM